MLSREQTAVWGIALLAALLIAASNVGQISGATLIGGYAYWIVRIGIEGALFVLVRDALDRSGLEVFPPWGHMWGRIAAAILISLVPFVLAITAFDIILGYPELGIENAANVPSTKLTAFAFELIYLFDNHVFLCLLLSLPRFLLAPVASSLTADDTEAPAVPKPIAARATMFTELDPPLRGELLWAEAQEHYVRLTTAEETRMVLNRFADVLRDLPEDAGIQVHRSHWVAIDAIAEAFREGANLRLRLRTEDIVPVSRSYRATTERLLKQARLMD